MQSAHADFLRGTLEFARGTFADYRALAHLHYVPRDPATIAGVWTVHYAELHLETRGMGAPPMRIASDKHGRELRRGQTSTSSLESSSRAGATGSANFPTANRKLIAVAVLSYPTPALRPRERVLNLAGPRYGARLRWVNHNLRTISRVIVHPQFRALGIASRLVRRVLNDCPTRYVEAVAAMGAVHPFFLRAGMTMVERASEDEPAYFIFDREKAWESCHPARYELCHPERYSAKDLGGVGVRDPSEYLGMTVPTQIAQGE